MTTLRRALEAEPQEVWAQPVNFGPKLPDGTAAANPSAVVTGGHTLDGTILVGTYNSATNTWTTEVSGQWVLIKGTAGNVPGNSYIVTVEIDGPDGTTPTVSFYAPVAKHS